MPTPRETILTALLAQLSTLPATALRGEVLPERVPAGGLLILRDGEPGEPEVTLSPLAYHYGRSSRPSSWLTSRRASCWSRKKTPRRPCRMGLRWGRRILPSLPGHLPGLPPSPECTADLRGRAGLGSGGPSGWAVARLALRKRHRLGHGRGFGNGRGAGRAGRCGRRTAASNRGGNGREAQ